MRAFVVAIGIGAGALLLGGLGVAIGVGPRLGIQHAEFPVLVFKRPHSDVTKPRDALTFPTPASRRDVGVESFLHRNDVRDVATRGGNAFIATAGGLRIVPTARVLDPRAGLWLTGADGLPAHDVRAVVADGGGIWVASGAAVVRIENDPKSGWNVVGVVEPAVVTGEARAGLKGAPAPAAIADIATGERGLLVASHGDGAFVVRHCKQRDGFCAKVLPVRGGRTVRTMTSVATGRVGGQDTIALGTAGAGVVVVRGRTDVRYNQKAGVRADLTTDVAIQGDVLLVSTVAGVSRFDGRYWHDDVDGYGLATPGTAVVTLEDSRLRIRGGGGWRAQKTLDATEVRGAIDLPSGRLVATDNGLWAVPHAAEQPPAAINLGGPPTADISSLALSSGRLWIGGFDGGLSLYDGEAFVRIATDELDPHVNAVRVVPAASDERASEIWVATIGGVYRAPLFRGLPPSSGWTRWGEEDGLPASHTNALAVGDDVVWIGTSEGLAVARRDERGRWRLRRAWRPGHGLGFRIVYSAAIAPDGVWVAGLGGAAHFDGETFTNYSFEAGELPDPWVNAVAVEPGGAAWFGTYDKGMARLDGQEWSYFGESASGPESGWVFPNASVVLPDGTVWFGTMGGGLVGLDADGWRAFGIAEGLAGDDVTSLAYDPDADTLWVGTRTGLSAVTFHAPEAS